MERADSSSSRGTRTLLLFGCVTLLSGAEMCGQRLVDLYALRPAKLLPEKELLTAGNYDRVRFDPGQLRFADALYYRSDLKTFSEQDPRKIVTVNGEADLAALTAKRRELHGVHLVIENVPIVPPLVMLDADDRWKSLRGEASVERMYGPLAGSGDMLWIGAPIVGDRGAAAATFTGRTRFEGTVNALIEENHYDDLVNHIRATRPAVNPYAGSMPYVVLEGQAAAPAHVVTRLIPLGGTYNLFVAAPEGVDLANTPAEGTIGEPIESPRARGALRRMAIAIGQSQLTAPLRIIYPGDAKTFRASAYAPTVVPPGGAIFLALGLICSVLGIVLGARRDRSGTEGKLWFEGVIAFVELAAVAVPALYFLLHRSEQPPAPLMGGAPAVVASVELHTQSNPVPSAHEKPEELDAAKAAVVDIRTSKTASSLALNASIATTACAKVSAAKVPSSEALRVCGRERAVAEVQTAIALLAKPGGDKKPLCQLAARASARLVDEKLHDEKDVAEDLARLGKACL